MKRTTKKSSMTLKSQKARDIKRCYSCRDGRLIRHKELIFCGFCGKEFRKTSF